MPGSVGTNSDFHRSPREIEAVNSLFLAVPFVLKKNGGITRTRRAKSRRETVMEDGEWVVVPRPSAKDLWRPSSWEEDGPRPLKVTFAEPAKHWTDAIPIGNGRLGAMVWGGVASETLQLNGKPPGALLRFCVSDHWHWNLAADSHLGFACFGFLLIQVLYL